ncbi:uncharacterized protein LOC144349581, partial [Saccoglossus kowalevskii]
VQPWNPNVSMHPESIRKIARKWLCENNNWLLVIEDADNPEIVKQFIPDYSELGSGHILITSRMKDDWEYLGWKLKKHEVNLLSDEDSALLLLMRIKSSSVEDAKRELDRLHHENSPEYEALMWLVGEEALHRLPLALVQASMYIVEYKISFLIYKQRYLKGSFHALDIPESDPLTYWMKENDVKKCYTDGLRRAIGNDMIKLKELPQETLTSDLVNMTGDDLKKFQCAQMQTPVHYLARLSDFSRRSVQTTWDLAYDELCTREKFVKEFLHLCCCMAPVIHVEVLVEGAKFLNPGSLKDFLLESTGDVRGVTHGEVIREEKVRKCFNELQKFSFATVMFIKHETTYGRMGAFALHHLLQQVVFSKRVCPNSKVRAMNNALCMLKNIFPKVEEVKADFGYPDDVIHQRHSILAFHVLALARQMDYLKKDDIMKINKITELFTAVGTYLRRLGRVEDVEVLYKSMVHIQRLRRPCQELLLALDLRSLGKVYYDLDKLAEAEKVFHESLTLYKKLLPDADDDIQVLKEKREEVKQLLIDILEKKQKYFERIGDRNNYSVAYAFTQLGRFYQDTKQYKKAQDPLAQSLKIREAYAREKYDTTKTINIAVTMTILARNHLLQSLDMRYTEELLVRAFQIKEKQIPQATDSYQIGIYYLAMLYRYHIKDIAKYQTYFSRLEPGDYKTRLKTGKSDDHNKGTLTLMLFV